MTVSVVKESGNKVMLVTNGADLAEMVALFEQALRGAGFVFDGHFELEEE